MIKLKALLCKRASHFILPVSIIAFSLIANCPLVSLLYIIWKKGLVLYSKSVNCKMHCIFCAKSERLRTVIRVRKEHDTGSKQHNMSWSKGSDTIWCLTNTRNLKISFRGRWVQRPFESELWNIAAYSPKYNRPFRGHLCLHFKARLSANQFSYILKLHLITITKISHLDSLWRRDLGELFVVDIRNRWRVE